MTGFELSPEGLAIASAEAARAGVALETTVDTVDRFKYGDAEWDAIAVIYRAPA